jgi:hypothetical protein
MKVIAVVRKYIRFQVAGLSKLYALLTPILVMTIIAASGVAQAQTCEDLFDDTNGTVIDELECPAGECQRILPSFLFRFGHNVPLVAKFVRPKITPTDVNLLLRSYTAGTHNPIEYGIAELYDKAGNLLDSSGPIRGNYASISLIPPLQNLIGRNFHRFDKIHRVVLKHTHPLNYSGDDPALTTRFSDGDIDAGVEIRKYLDLIPKGSRLKFESYIIYFRPGFVETIENPGSALSDFEFIRKNRGVQVIGYHPKK